MSLALCALIAVLSIALAMAVFALGQTILSPLGPAIVNEIAPEHLRGRYNAAKGLTWGVSRTIAPATAALHFDNGLIAWVHSRWGARSLVGGALMLNLRRPLSAGQVGRMA